MESKKSVFVDRAMSCHGERYDYSKSNYLGARIPIEIICPIHGSFYQLPFNHIRGVGCPKCKADKSKSIKYGVGINDMIGMEKTLAYEIWNKMLARCYSEREQKRRPTYVGGLRFVMIGCILASLKNGLMLIIRMDMNWIKIYLVAHLKYIVQIHAVLFHIT